MDRDEPRASKPMLVVVPETPKPPMYDWTKAKVLDADRMRARARENVHSMLRIHGVVIGADGPEGAALIAAMEAYVRRE